MAGRKAFLVRIDPAVLAAVQRWADEDLRSLNGQIEFLLRRALAQQGIKLGATDGPADRGESPPGAPR
jgi:hypothetical protein